MPWFNINNYTKIIAGVKSNITVNKVLEMNLLAVVQR